MSPHTPVGSSEVHHGWATPISPSRDQPQRFLGFAIGRVKVDLDHHEGAVRNWQRQIYPHHLV